MTAPFDSSSPAQCKQVIAAALADLGLPPYRLTARTIDFTDLARRKMVFVQVHDWNPDPRFAQLQRIAIAHDFRVEAR